MNNTIRENSGGQARWFWSGGGDCESYSLEHILTIFFNLIGDTFENNSFVPYVRT